MHARRNITTKTPLFLIVNSQKHVAYPVLPYRQGMGICFDISEKPGYIFPATGQTSIALVFFLIE